MSELKQQGKVSEAAEDISGFGVPALRTLRDLVLRPRAVVEAMETGGPTGGGRYTTPLRFFLAINSVGMVVFFLFGGMEGIITQTWPPDVLARAAEKAGKSPDAWVADFDQWASLFIVPVVGVALAAIVVPLVKAWRKAPWLAAFREGLTAINSWTVVSFALAPLLYNSAGNAGLAAAVQTLIFLLVLYPFIRIGAGRWYRTVVGGVLKALLLLVLVFICSIVANAAVWAIGFLGAMYA